MVDLHSAFSPYTRMASTKRVCFVLINHTTVIRIANFRVNTFKDFLGKKNGRKYISDNRIQ